LQTKVPSKDAANAPLGILNICWRYWDRYDTQGRIPGMS
jgi:hypothetical protein